MIAVFWSSLREKLNTADLQAIALPDLATGALKGS